MTVVRIAKHLSFDSAHYLLRPDLSREENIGMFHKCCLYKEDGSDEPHGHTYHLEVVIAGPVSPDNGFVIDFKELKAILRDGVVEKLDHRLINNIPWFKDRLATVENILQYVWEEIEAPILAIRPSIWIDSIKMYETPDSYAILHVEDILNTGSDSFMRKNGRFWEQTLSRPSSHKNSIPKE